jgi:riboflavin synthase
MNLTEARAAARHTAPGLPQLLVAALDEIERRCDGMNQGAPGWELRDRILDILAGRGSEVQR